MPDVIKIEILDDGTIKMETDKVSMPNHAGAEALVREVIKGAGGAMEKTRKSSHGHYHGTEYHEHN